MIVWEMSHGAADKVKEKQAGSGPMGASERQTDIQMYRQRGHAN